jgi:hypothetical protein
MGKHRNRKAQKRALSQRSKKGKQPVLNYLVSKATLIVSAVGFLSALAFTYELLFDTVPAVEVHYVDPVNPFAFPFYLRNRSFLFTMYNTLTACRGNISAGTDQFKDSGFSYRGTGKVIAPNGTANFSCGLDVGSNRVTLADLDLGVTYKTRIFGILPWQRKYLTLQHVRLRRNAKGEAQWIEGQRLNWEP